MLDLAIRLEKWTKDLFRDVTRHLHSTKPGLAATPVRMRCAHAVVCRLRPVRYRAWASHSYRAENICRRVSTGCTPTGCLPLITLPLPPASPDCTARSQTLLSSSRSFSLGRRAARGRHW